jgi:hypothetical protein
MSDRWRYRRQGFLAALLLTAAGVGAWAWHDQRRGVEPLPDDARNVLVRDRWRERRIVDRVPVEVPVEVVRHVRVVERVEVPVPGERVEVVRTVESACDPGPVTLGGVEGVGCVVERVEAGGEVFARATWSCRAEGPGWHAERVGVPVPDVRFEAQLGEARPPLRSMLELRAGPWAEADQAGVRAGATWYRAGRRFGVAVDADLALDPATIYVDGPDYRADRWRVAALGAVRLGRR